MLQKNMSVSAVNIEKMFKLKAFRMTITVLVIVLILEAAAYHLIAQNKFSYNYCLNIFPECTPVKTTAITSEKNINEYDITMHIDNVSIYNDIVTIKISGENMTANHVDVTFGKEFLLTVINPQNAPVRRYYHKVTRAACIAKANSYYSFTLFYNISDLDTVDNIYTLSIHKINSNEVTEIVLPKNI
jgi:hypothetical protein